MSNTRYFPSSVFAHSVPLSMSIFMFILLLDQKINESSCQKGDFKGLSKALPSGPAQPSQKEPSGNQVRKFESRSLLGMMAETLSGGANAKSLNMLTNTFPNI